jgi:hypothetical protein
MIVLDQWYSNAQAGCDTDTSCTVTPSESANIANGDYQWRILDYGEYGYGNWTAFQNFIPPANAVLGDPVGTLTSWDHAFHWTGNLVATSYYLEVQTLSGTIVSGTWYTSAEAGCDGSTTCAASPNQALHISNGDYRWRILDYGGYGYGRWTAFRDFSLNLPPASATLATPSGVLTEWDRSFQWTGFPDSTWYYLMVQTSTGSTVFDAWYTNTEAGCATDTSCVISPVQALHVPNGDYQWRILDYGGYGYGTWTDWQSFSLNIPPVGGILGAPSGTLTSWNRSFQWTGFPDSTWYFLEVQTSTGTPVFDAWYTNTQAGCEVSTSCAILPSQALSLPNGDYQWRILDYGAYGYGTWTPFQSFTLNLPIPIAI